MENKIVSDISPYRKSQTSTKHLIAGAEENVLNFGSRSSQSGKVHIQRDSNQRTVFTAGRPPWYTFQLLSPLHYLLFPRTLLYSYSAHATLIFLQMCHY